MRTSPSLLAAAAAGRTILTPNAELAAALFDAIEREHQAAGEQVWPTPRVRVFGSWLREQYALAAAADAALPRQLSDIEERELWRQIVDASAAGQDLLDAGAAARAARRARRTVYEYAIPWTRLAAEATQETAIFLDWNRSFEARCRDLQCIGSEVPLGALSAPLDELVWIDSPSWRPAARQWLASRARLLLPEAVSQTQLSILHAPTPSRELAAMAAWMAERLSQVEGFRAWIYVPGLARRRSDIEDAFDAQLAPERFSLTPTARPAHYAVAGGTPLADYASVRAALDFLQASVGVVSFKQFSALLRAPQLQESAKEASAAARIDVLLRRHGPHDSALPEWLRTAEELAQRHGLIPAASVRRLRAALEALGMGRTARPMSEWILTWLRAFNAAPWSMQQRWSSTEFQAAQRFRELLAALAGAEAFFGTQTRDSAQRLLLRCAHDTAFQPQTGTPPILISGQLLDPWLNYDALWLGGMSDVQWPAPPEPVALLPGGLQRSFGVQGADAGSQLAMSRDYLRRWQQRGAHCVFSLSDAGDGPNAAPSALLPSAAQSSAIREAAAHPHWHALQTLAPPLQKFSDERAPPFAAGERTRGVHTLRAQSRCAFRGFAEIRLDAAKLEQPVPGFNERERGELVHHALEHVWKVLKDSQALNALDEDSQRTLLTHAANHALREVCQSRDPGAQWRRRERERLHNLLSRWLEVERGRAPFAVESLERSAHLAHFGGLALNVRVDRVDRLEDGARVLIDYKTGSAPVDWRGARPDNPQLPIYALLLPEALVAVAYGKVNAADARFVPESERGQLFPGRAKTSLEGQPGLGALIEVWSHRIEALAAAFAAGRAEVAPTSSACRSCDLQGLCRVPTVLQEPDQYE